MRFWHRVQFEYSITQEKWLLPNGVELTVTSDREQWFFPDRGPVWADPTGKVEDISRVLLGSDQLIEHNPPAKGFIDIFGEPVDDPD